MTMRPQARDLWVAMGARSWGASLFGLSTPFDRPG